MHFDHEPAASMMFDFAGNKIPFTDLQTGEIIWCPVLVCMLPFSGYTYIEASCCQPTGNGCSKALNNALNYFGGVPRSVKDR